MRKCWQWSCVGSWILSMRDTPQSLRSLPWNLQFENHELFSKILDTPGLLKLMRNSGICNNVYIYTYCKPSTSSIQIFVFHTILTFSNITSLICPHPQLESEHPGKWQFLRPSLAWDNIVSHLAGWTGIGSWSQAVSFKFRICILQYLDLL